METSAIKAGEFPRTKFWGLAIEGEGYQRFESTRDLLRFLSGWPKDEPLILYHHHDFDPIQVFVDRCVLSIQAVRGSRLLSCTGPVPHVEWRNSHALFPSSLAEILSATGAEKLPMACAARIRESGNLVDPTRVLPHEEGCTACDAALGARNLSDCEAGLLAFRGLAGAYETAFGIYPLGGKYLTAAGVAFAAAQERAGPLPVDLERRESFRGGRVEGFRVGDCGPSELYDINSSYPFAFTDLPPTDTLIKARVEVTGDGPAPCFRLPAPGERGKLLFPKGRFSTWLFASSLERYVLPHKAITALKVDEAYKVDLRWFAEVGAMAREVYEARLAAKKAGNAPLAYAQKILLNSIFGRVGLKPERTLVLLKDCVASDDNVEYYPLPDGRFLNFVKVDSKPKANYPMAAAVTDNSRARLYDAMMRAGRVFYCDTDSIFAPPGVMAKALRPEEIGNKLGQWKKESWEDKKTRETGEVAPFHMTSAKDYAWGPLLKRKGGSGGFTHTIKNALGGTGVRANPKTRKSTYDKRRIIFGGATLPQVYEDW